MKKYATVFFIFFVVHVNLFAQKTFPRIENDTLYTASGFKFYNGQVLTLGNPIGYSVEKMERGISNQ
jgi:hypothetical protein